jgi:uncharacterized membrane protein YdcZ (DUF606 family)
MSADITPEQARSETIENLIHMANMYRAGTGAHTVVSNEINRRAESKKNFSKVLFAMLTAFCTGIIGLIFWLLHG